MVAPFAKLLPLRRCSPPGRSRKSSLFFSGVSLLPLFPARCSCVWSPPHRFFAGKRTKLWLLFAPGRRLFQHCFFAPLYPLSFLQGLLFFSPLFGPSRQLDAPLHYSGGPLWCILFGELALRESSFHRNAHHFGPVRFCIPRRLV